MFAEIKTYAQGDKPTFILKLSKNRAKQFITRVGLAGIYEVFKLDKKSMEITCEAYGGAAQIGLEEFFRRSGRPRRTFRHRSNWTR